MLADEPLSEDFVEAATAERDRLAARLAEAEERAAHFEALAAAAQSGVVLVFCVDSRDRGNRRSGATARFVRDEREATGRATSRSRSRGVPSALPDEDSIHYRAWFDALLESGYRLQRSVPWGRIRIFGASVPTCSESVASGAFPNACPASISRYGVTRRLSMSASAFARVERRGGSRDRR